MSLRAWVPRSLELAAAVALLAGALSLPAAANGQGLTSGPVFGGPVLADGRVLWADRDEILGHPSAFRVPLPAPGAVDDLEVRGAEPTELAAARGLIAVRRSVYACYPALPGEATTSCVSSPEVLAGAVGEPLRAVVPSRRCSRLVVPRDSLAIAAGSVIVVEPSSDCRAIEMPARIVAIDPRRPNRRRVLATAFGPVVRAAGPFVVWTDRTRRTLHVVDLRGGRARRLALGGATVDGFDVQADGAVAAAVGGRHVAVFRRGAQRRLGIRAAGPIRVERDRIAGFSRGRFFVRDLAGRPAGLDGEKPDAVFDFDGRSATWVRTRELEPPTRCPDAPAPSPPCTRSPGRYEQSLRRALVAR